LAAFQNECRNAEQALDAPAVRHLRRRKLIEAHPDQTPEEIRRMMMEVGTRLCDLTEEEFREAKAARREWTRLPGYEYLHPVLHFDREIPLLLSLPALGNARALRVSLQAGEPIGAKWYTVAWQLSQAVRFLMDYPELAHVDIKPDNILYNYKGDDNKEGLHCWLSDYGDLFPKAKRTDFKYGTREYKPHILPKDATYLQQSLHCFYATLMNLFVVCMVPDGKVTHLSRIGNISELVANAMRGEETHHWLSHIAPAELIEHVMAPMMMLNLSDLLDAFDDTCEWLRIITVRAHPRGGGLLERN
jgi:serine/threonine protein kinase